MRCSRKLIGINTALSMASPEIRGVRTAWCTVDMTRVRHLEEIISLATTGRILRTTLGQGQSRITKERRLRLLMAFRSEKGIWLKQKRLLIPSAAEAVPQGKPGKGMIC